MNSLLLQTVDWLGYLQRGPVVLQLLVIAAMAILQVRQSPKVGTSRNLLAPAVLLGLGEAGLALHWPTGLLRLSGLIWLSWTLIPYLKPLLNGWLSSQQIHELDTRLLRPLLLIWTAGCLINLVGSTKNLAMLPAGELFDVPLTIGKLCSIGFSAYLLLMGAGPIAAALAWLLQRLIGISDGSRKAFALILRYSVSGLGITALLFEAGMNGTALLAIAGGLSVGLGFGIKEVFSNFVSGIWLLMEGSVRPGEVLLLDGDHCEVRRLGLRATALWRSRDNAELLIPNQIFFTQAATSFTSTDRKRRSETVIRAAYHHQPKVVIKLMEKTAASIRQVLTEPAPQGLLKSYDDFYITYTLRFWIANPMNHTRIRSKVNQALWEAFAKHQIDIPLPQHVQYTIEDQPERTNTNPWPPL